MYNNNFEYDYSKGTYGYLFRKLKPVTRVKVYLKMFKALSIMHENNIVHGDIKPDNIMTSSNFFEGEDIKPVFIDYGIMDFQN